VPCATTDGPTRHLQIRNELLGGRPTATAVLLGPRDADETCVVDVFLPRAQHRDPRVQLMGQVLGPQGIAGEECPHLVADLLLLFVERELHADLPNVDWVGLMVQRERTVHALTPGAP